MADYIDKNDLKEYISGYIKSCNGKPIYTDIDALVGIIDLLEAKPAADVQPVNRWISVNDKLPEQDEKVLVLTKDKDIMTMIYKEIPFRWYKPKFGGFDKDYVTHWKPLKESDTE